MERARGLPTPTAEPRVEPKAGLGRGDPKAEPTAEQKAEPKADQGHPSFGRDRQSHALQIRADSKPKSLGLSTAWKPTGPGKRVRKSGKHHAVRRASMPCKAGTGTSRARHRPVNPARPKSEPAAHGAPGTRRPIAGLGARRAVVTMGTMGTMARGAGVRPGHASAPCPVGILVDPEHSLDAHFHPYAYPEPAVLHPPDLDNVSDSESLADDLVLAEFEISDPYIGLVLGHPFPNTPIESDEGYTQLDIELRNFLFPVLTPDVDPDILVLIHTLILIQNFILTLMLIVISFLILI